LTAEVDGKSIPMRDHPFVKEATDFPTFVKSAYEAHREVGARIPVKVDASKPETVEAWRKEHLPKLYKAGVLQAPPASPEEYAFAKPETVPDGLKWDPERAAGYAKLAHKHGLSKEAAQELMDFHLQTLQGARAALKTTYDNGMVALKKEFGDQYDTRFEQAGRIAASILKNEAELEFFEELGLANHPTFLSLLMRLAPLVEQDSTVLRGLGGSESGGMTGEDVRRELADIMGNPENPKHKLYWSRDKGVLEYVDGLYRKVYGDAKIQIGGMGLNVSA
jgi:hypothetical protein